jgi:FkbM family methyltransferase
MDNCKCTRIRWPNDQKADGSLLNLSLALSELSPAHEELLQLRQGWHVEQSKRARNGTTVAIAVNRTGWVPTIVQAVHAWFHPPLIRPLPCSNSRGEDSVIFRTFFHSANGHALQGIGTFLEIGAFDGLSESNSFYSERCRSWKGLLVEGARVNFQKLVRNRPNVTTVRAAVCEKEGLARFSSEDGTAAKLIPESSSSVERTARMPSRRQHGSSGNSVRCAALSSLLQESFGETPRVDFFSLDIEGSEPAAIATLGHAASFGCVVVEVNAGWRRIRVMRAMLARGFLYAGQISARPTLVNFVSSDVFYNRSHFRRFWPSSRAAE